MSEMNDRDLIIAVSADGASVADLANETLASRFVTATRQRAAFDGAKGADEFMLALATHGGAAAVLELSRLLLAWVRRKPGVVLHILQRDGKSKLTVRYETKLVERQEVERLARDLYAIAELVDHRDV